MKEILSSQKTASIASVDEKGFPHVSYAPYVIDGNKVYIYISQIAEHYKNIESNGKISLMVIRDENDTQNLFARERVVFNGFGTKLNDVKDEIKQKFEEIHGSQMMSVLYKMDFDFFEVDIEYGRLVKGFGRAYDLRYDGESWVEEHVVVDKGEKPHSR